jgi:hypothetical protein
MKFLNKKGNVLLFVVVAMTTISVLGTGIYFLTTTSIFSGLDANAQNRAYQLAVAGRDYALVKNLTAAEGGYFTFTNGDKFRLQIGVNNSDEIISTGIVNEGTPYEANGPSRSRKQGSVVSLISASLKTLLLFPRHRQLHRPVLSVSIRRLRKFPWGNF